MAFLMSDNNMCLNGEIRKMLSGVIDKHGE